MQIQRWMMSMLIATAITSAYGQQKAMTPAPGQIDLEVGYSADPNNLTNGKSILLQGGNLELTGHLWHGLAGVASVTGLHTGSSGTGVPQNLVIEAFGPRFTFAGRVKHFERTSAFVQALIGEANGFNGVFPGKSGADTSANGFALVAGGGVDIALRQRISLRVLHINFLQTQLPNGTSNVQRSVLVGAGVIWHTK